MVRTSTMASGVKIWSRALNFGGVLRVAKMEDDVC